VQSLEKEREKAALEEKELWSMLHAAQKEAERLEEELGAAREKQRQAREAIQRQTEGLE
jgi:hypothetical protein